MTVHSDLCALKTGERMRNEKTKNETKMKENKKKMVWQWKKIRRYTEIHFARIKFIPCTNCTL